MSIDKALELYKDEKYNEAIDAFSSVLETEGDNAEVYNNIGLCYANLGEDEKAEKMLSTPVHNSRIDLNLHCQNNNDKCKTTSRKLIANENTICHP